MSVLRRFQYAHAFFLLATLVNISLLSLWWMSAHDISNESGLIENLQAGILVLVLALYCFYGIRLEGAGRTIAVMVCFLCFYLFFREVDFQTFTESERVLSITRGRNQKLIFWISLLLLSVYVICQFKYLRALVTALLHWRAWPYYLWFVLLIFGGLVEEVSKAKNNFFGGFAIPHGQLLEEMLEFNAYAALLFAGVTFFEFNRFFFKRAECGTEKIIQQPR